MKTANLIGAILASFAFLLVIFAGTLGQLFTMTGRTSSVPSYGTSAVQSGWDIGNADPMSYDELGKFIDFAKIPGEVGTSAETTDGVCHNRTYVVALKHMEVWKKGSALAAMEGSLHYQIDPVLKACAVPVGTDFSCEAGCSAEGDDDVIDAKPLAISLLAANAVGPGILQYTFSLNAGCIRIRHCIKSSQ